MQSVLSSMAVEEIGPGSANKNFAKLLKSDFLNFKNHALYRSPITAFFTAMERLGVKEGDNVAISAFSDKIYNVLLGNLGLSCSLLDVDPDVGQVSAGEVLKLHQEKKLAAFVCSSSLSRLPDLAPIHAAGIKIFCDITDSIGNEIDASNIDIAFLSLEDDALITAGGGAGLFSNERLERPLRGDELCDINSSLALKQLENYDFFLKKRKEIQKTYVQAAGLGKNRVFSNYSEESKDNALHFALVLDNFKEALGFLDKRSIPVRKTFSNTIFEELEDKSPFPNCIALYSKVYSFPLYYYLKGNEIDLVRKVISVLP